MQAICLNAKAGGFPVGLKLAGIEPVMIVEEENEFNGCLSKNFSQFKRILPDLFDRIPKYDILCGSYDKSFSNHDIFFLLEKTKPRVLFLRFHVRADLDSLFKKMDEYGYRTWENIINIRTFMVLQRREKYIIAFRKDIKIRWNNEFGYFPLPEPTYAIERIKMLSYEDRFVPSINGHGFMTAGKLTINGAKKAMGYPEDYDFSDIEYAVYILRDASPLVIGAIAREIVDWAAPKKFII